MDGSPRAFRNVSARIADPQFITQRGQWNSFISQLTDAHEKDLADAQAQAAQAAEESAAAKTHQGEKSRKGIYAKDLKPMKFDSNIKSAQSFKQFPPGHDGVDEADQQELGGDA